MRRGAAALRLLGELYGYADVTGSAPRIPLEAIGRHQGLPGAQLVFQIGGGAGLLRAIIIQRGRQTGSPRVRAFIGFIFEPTIGDRDGDGIKDDVDKCPDEPEDFDGFEDEDGCPEPDNDQRRHPRRRRQVPERSPRTSDGFEDEDGCPEGNESDRDGDGILDDVDKCPDEPEDKDGFEDEDGCPDPDNDKDGILDVDDLCPNDPEDKDGFEDEDGCPDPDNDKDRILDKDDKCPNEPETYNGFEDEDGCPDKRPRRRRPTTRSRSSRRSTSRPTRRSSSRVVPDPRRGRGDAARATRSISLIEVQGHTDERGDDDVQPASSPRIARAVGEALPDRARASTASRLESQGYGETQPLDPQHNEAAWAKNRRVEFIILKQKGEIPGQD